MKSKRVLSLMLGLTMTAGLLAGCGSSGDSENKETDASAGNVTTNADENGEITNITIMIASMGQEPVDMQKISDAMNEITEKEIGIHADWIISSGTTYAQQVSMKMSSGEDLDLICTQGLDFNTLLSQNQIMPLDELIDSYGQDLKTAIPETYMDACNYQGTHYLIPVVATSAISQPIILVRSDMAQEAGWDMDRLATIKTADDFEQLMSDVKEKYPDISIFSPLAANFGGPAISSINGLFTEDSYDALSNSMGVIASDSTTVENFWASDLFKEECYRLKDWYDKGYIWTEALTSSTTAIDTYLFSGNLFSFAFSSATDVTEPFAQAQTGVFANAPTVNIPIGRVVITTTDIISHALAIPSTSQHADAAMKYLNYFYNSEELENLLCNGIEGEHYTVDENGLVEGTENQANYTNSFNMYFGNEQLLLNSKENGADYYQNLIASVSNARKSDALGYVPDMSELDIESVAVTNVCSEYLGGLLIGAVDVDSQLPKFLDELDSAGLQTIIDAKQAQLNEFLTSK